MASNNYRFDLSDSSVRRTDRSDFADHISRVRDEE